MHDPTMKMWIVECPWCHAMVWIEQINCAIFRHAVWRTTMEPVNPHATREQLEQWHSAGLLLGCAKPFRLVPKTGSTESTPEYEAIVCDYL